MAGKRGVGTHAELRRRVRALRDEFQKVHARGMRANRDGDYRIAGRAAMREHVLIKRLVRLIERSLRSRFAAPPSPDL
jgi:hypothetical protein